MAMRDNTFHIGFAPSMVAGMRTQWENMWPRVRERSDVAAYVAEIDKYKAGGLVEALPLVPPVIKGNVRSIVCASNLFRARRLDALWMHEIRPALPYVLSKGLLQ